MSTKNKESFSAVVEDDNSLMKADDLLGKLAAPYHFSPDSKILCVGITPDIEPVCETNNFFGSEKAPLESSFETMWHPMATFDAVDLSTPKEYPQKIQLPFDVEFCRMGEEPRFYMRIADANGHHKDVSLVPDEWAQQAYETLPDVREKINRGIVEGCADARFFAERNQLVPEGARENPVGAHVAFDIVSYGAHDLMGDNERPDRFHCLACVVDAFHKHLDDILQEKEASLEDIQQKLQASQYPLFSDATPLSSGIAYDYALDYADFN